MASITSPMYIRPDEYDCATGPDAMTVRQAPYLGLPNSPKLPLFFLSFGFIDPQFGWSVRNEQQLGRMTREDAERQLEQHAAEHGFVLADTHA